MGEHIEKKLHKNLLLYHAYVPSIALSNSNKVIQDRYNTKETWKTLH